jgi:hypothetical protein
MFGQKLLSYKMNLWSLHINMCVSQSQDSLTHVFSAIVNTCWLVRVFGNSIEVLNFKLSMLFRNIGVGSDEVGFLDWFCDHTI